MAEKITLIHTRRHPGEVVDIRRRPMGAAREKFSGGEPVERGLEKYLAEIDAERSSRIRGIFRRVSAFARRLFSSTAVRG